jgi:hypothetical protein
MRIKRDFEQISKDDLDIRRTFPAEPGNTPQQKTVLATIEVIGGFELFNTYPYHNYETWGQGYRVSSQGTSVESEYLDDAIELWRIEHAKRKNEDN